MRIPREELAAVIGEKTLHQKDMRRLAKAVAAYLLEHGAVDELESLMRDVLAYRQAHGVVEAEAISAHELSAETLKEATAVLKEQYPKAKHVLVHNHLDPTVVGGVKLQLANEQLDLTVRSKLDTFKRLTESIN